MGQFARYTLPAPFSAVLALPMPKKPRGEKPTKLRKDVNEVAHRVMLEATGQSPKTPPPGERSEDEKNPEAVKRGKKGGRPQSPRSDEP